MPRARTNLALLVLPMLALGGCASTAASTDESPAEESPEATTITVEDNAGTKEVPSPATSVVALDNRTFETLSDWGIQLSAAAVSLMPDTVPYTENADVVDIGNHREPNLELIAAANPDLVISGQRFTDRDADIQAMVPDATLLQLEARDGEPFDEELRRQTRVLGEVFGKTDEADALIADFDASIQRAKDAYDGQATVMAVATSGGEIGYLAPSVGRTLGPVFDILELTPALEVDEASDDHQGDDISVELIAQSEPEWLLVMDRDAAVSADEPEFTPAADVLENSEVLSEVPAVKESHIVYMPADTYTNEGIQTYTEFFNSFAGALEGGA